MGGLDEKFEGRFSSLTITGRQKIAEKFRPDMIKIGNHMRRNKPGDIRAILEMDIVQSIDAEELGKFFRFAIETSKIDDFLKQPVGNTFSRNGVLYQVDALFNLKRPVYKLDAKSLEKSPQVNTKLEVRNTPPDMNAPVLIWETNGRQVIVDGLHRIQSAIKSNRILNVQYLTDKDMQSVALTDFYSKESLNNLVNYKTGLALEQDASSSGAQIIALTTRNKQLAELSNVVPTNQKRRLYGLVKSRELLGRL